MITALYSIIEAIIELEVISKGPIDLHRRESADSHRLSSGPRGGLGRRGSCSRADSEMVSCVTAGGPDGRQGN